MNELPELVSEIGWQVVRSTLVVAGLLMLRQATKRYVSAKWLYLICILGSLWLLVPATPPSLLSIWRLVPGTLIEAKPIIGQAGDEAPISVLSPLSFHNEITLSQTEGKLLPVEGELTKNVPVELNSNPKTAPSWFYGILAVWGIGSFILLLAWLSREIKIRILVGRSKPSSDPKLLRLLAESKAILGVNREVRIIPLKSRRSPALVGIFRPMIVVGRNFDSDLSYEEIKHVFLHELAHLKRGDLLSRILFKIAFIVQWPNPVSWWLANASLDDMEIATDELVLQYLSREEERHAYGDTLLKIARSLSQSHPFLKSHLLGMAAPYQSNLETRIKMIANHNEFQNPKWPIVLILISAVVVSLLMGFKPAVAQSDLDDVEPVPGNVSSEEKTQQVFEIEQKLKTIIIPLINFSDTKLSDAVGILQQLSKEHDESGSGVTIHFSKEARIEFGDKPITLRLSNVPLSEALRYMTNLAQARYRIEPDGVEIRKLPDPNLLYTNTFTVPPTFLHRENGGVDPFANPGKSKLPSDRNAAMKILKNAGITFGVGCSAIYNPANSQLIVRNNQEQMELVEAYLDSLMQAPEKQIYVTIREIQVDPTFTFDEKDEFLEGLLTLPALPDFPEANRAVVFDSRESFQREFSKPPSKPDLKRERTGRKIAGVLTDPQNQTLFKALEQRKGVEILKAPSVMSRSGQISMSQADDRRYGVNTVILGDGYTIDLQVFLAPPQKALFKEGDSFATPYELTIWDGQTAVLAEQRENSKGRFVFVKAQIMDPAGIPIHGKNELKVEELIAREVMGNPEFQDEVKKADEAALRGSQLMANGSYKEATKEFFNALIALPVHEITADRRVAYEKQLANAQKGN